MSPLDPTGDGTRKHTSTTAELAAAFDIVVREGPNVGLRAHLEPQADKLIVGTAAGCDVRVADLLVSRRHLSLEWTPQGALLTDLGSTNGTFVNDMRVVEVYVTSSSRVRLGSTVLTIATGEATPLKRHRASALGRMAGSSARMVNVLELAKRVASAAIPVVLEGETGTGKEFLAERIHEASPRTAQPFMVLDCRTTPRELALPYLFGELAADGSVRAGILEQANGGTLLVDEPGDLPLDVQAQLLRALDGGIVTRVGDTRPIAIDVRVIATSSRNLDKLVEEGTLREDLYFRLAGARIEVPPLRRRREDIPLLASELWAQQGGEGELPEDFLERYAAYDWPGNVRELERAIERAMALGDKTSLVVSRPHRSITAAAPTAAPRPQEAENPLTKILRLNVGYSEARRLMLDEFQHAYLEKALADNGGNVGRAAAASGIARRHFQRIRAK